MGDALAVEICDGVMDGLVERGGVSEGLVGEMRGLEVAPDELEIVEFGSVFRQPFDGEPVCAGGQGGERAFAETSDPLSGAPALSIRDRDANSSTLMRIGPNGPNVCCC
jgi:hypothetical protein